MPLPEHNGGIDETWTFGPFVYVAGSPPIAWVYDGNGRKLGTTSLAIRVAQLDATRWVLLDEQASLHLIRKTMHG